MSETVRGKESAACDFESAEEKRAQQTDTRDTRAQKVMQWSFPDTQALQLHLPEHPAMWGISA